MLRTQKMLKGRQHRVIYQQSYSYTKIKFMHPFEQGSEADLIPRGMDLLSLKRLHADAEYAPGARKLKSDIRKLNPVTRKLNFGTRELKPESRKLRPETRILKPNTESSNQHTESRNQNIESMPH